MNIWKTRRLCIRMILFFATFAAIGVLNVAAIQPKVSSVVGSIASIYSSQRNHSEIFAAGIDGYLHYYYVENGTWQHDDTSFQATKVALSGAVSAIFSPQRNHAEVFFQGEDGYLHYYYVENGVWQHDDTSFQATKVATGGVVSAVFSPQRNHAEVFFQGEDGYLHYYYVENGTWQHDDTSFQATKVALSGAVSAIFSPQRNHAEVFFQGEDGYLHYYYVENGTWQHDGTSFQATKVALSGAVSAIFSPQRNHAEVFFQGEDGYLHYYYVENGTWQHDGTSFQATKVALSGAVSAVFSPQRNHAEVFFQGEDGYLRYYYVENGVWQHDDTSFRNVQSPNAVAAVFSPQREHAEVYLRGQDGYLHFYYVQNNSWQYDGTSLQFFFAALGVPVLRDFEDLPVGTAVFNQYDGVTFDGGDQSSHPITVIQSPVPAASPSNVLRSVPYYGACEFCGTYLVLKFDEGQHRVSLSTGLSPELNFGIDNQTHYAMLLEGYGADFGFKPIVKSLTPCLGNSPTPITTPLEIDDAAARIRFAELWLVNCSATDFPNSGGLDKVILLDNLVYDRPLHPLVRESDPPIVTITYPTNGATALGSTPGVTALTLQATITETAIYSMTAEVNGHAPVLVGYSRTGPQSYSANIQVDNTQGLISGDNTVRVNVWDFDRPQHTGSASTTFHFQVSAFPPPNELDVWPTAYEATQSIDYGPHLLDYDDRAPSPNPGYEINVPNQPPLIQGKRTVLRIYGGVTGSSNTINNVPAKIDVLRDRCTTDCIVAEGLPPMQNMTTPALKGITLFPFGTPASQPIDLMPHLENSWNFLLQPGWTKQDLVIRVNVNSGNYRNLPFQPSKPECDSFDNLRCIHNNTLKLHLHFQPMPLITVHPVIIHVTGTYNGVTYNDKKPSIQQIDAIFQHLNELYPARIWRGSLYDRTVDPGINKDDLLDIIKGYDRGIYSNNDDEMFIGIFPGDQGTFAANEGPAPGISTGGYGEVGGHGAWANANDSLDPAHELAHNIGLPHWGCENGVSEKGCEIFPIPHAGIGGVGFDIAKWSVIPPGDNTSNSTPHIHDFMSYGSLCSVQDSMGKYIYGGGPGCHLGDWVSWYTYGILLDHPNVASYDPNDSLALLVSAQRASADQALLVSGRIDPNGLARLRPIYQVSVNHPISDTIVEDDPDNIYTMQGYDSHGNTLFVHNFKPQKLNIHGPDYGKALIFDEAVPVLPDLQQLAVLKGPNMIGDIKNLEPGIIPTVHISMPIAATTWPVNTPQTIRWTKGPDNIALAALVQYSPDGGTTRITLGRDITTTELTINPDELAGSTNAFVYVQVSDGLNTSIDQVGPFTVVPKPPSVHIVTPSTGTVVLSHIPITLEGSGFDREETLVDTQFKWSSNLDGTLGTGLQLSTSTLSVGLHTLTLTATDSSGKTANDSIQVHILPQYALYLPLVQRGLK